jgi:hypothetical protein
MTLDLRTIARALGGYVAGGQVCAPGPGHSRKDDSLTVRLSPANPEGFVIHSKCGDDFGACRDYVRERLGLARPDKASAAPISARAIELLRQSEEADAKAKTARALRIWKEAQDPRGTIVETYLKRRGVELPADAFGEAVRFHPRTPFAGSFVPAMVCLVRNAVTNEPQAVHRTALTADGQKTEVNGNDRLSLGPIGGGAIKITPDEHVTNCLGVGEGFESTLSLRQLPEFGPSPVWCLLTANNLEILPVLAGVESLHIAVDHDKAGEKASNILAERWHGAGMEVFLIRANARGADINDVVKRRVA